MSDSVTYMTMCCMRVFTCGTCRTATMAATATAITTAAYRYGLEFPDHLTWTKWQAGGEYPKPLVVRNVSTQASSCPCAGIPSHSILPSCNT